MPVQFAKVFIADERYESAGILDVTGNGVLDIVSGKYWYEGPDFTIQHVVGEIRAVDEWFDDFSTIPMDVNGNGRLDVVTGGWWGDTLRWRENPGDSDKEWPEHVIAQTGSVETTRAWDVDGDGQLELVPNTPSGPLVAYKLLLDEQGRGTGEFAKHVLYAEKQGHGLGFGDITGNGHGDFCLSSGWLEAPEDPYAGEWTFHPGLDLGSASVPILVVDVNRNGLNDLIVGGAHRYGLDWLEQVREGGKITWVMHPIDPCNSQYHDLQWVDIDGDGEMELVTGKRYRAHNGKDPGSADPLGFYYFKWNGESFSKQVIDYGAPRVGKGCGIHFAVGDLNGNGRLDLVSPGKCGLYVYYNQGS